MPQPHTATADPRLAARYFAAFDERLLEFTAALTDFTNQVRWWKDKETSPKLPRKFRPFWRLIDAGMELSRWIMAEKGPPLGQRKPMEEATDLFLSFADEPDDIFVWMETNQPKFDLLVEAALNWPAKEDAPDEVELVFDLGPFTVHNTIEAEGDQLDQVRQLIERSQRHIQSMSGIVVDLDKVLRGDVMLVSKLQKSPTAAWYNADEDKLYLRPVRSCSHENIRAVIYELGHRYWQHFMTQPHKRGWRDYHAKLCYENTEFDVDLPGVGEEVTITPKIGDGRAERHPLVERIEGDRFYLEEGGYLTRRQFYDWYRERAMRSKFPGAAGKARSAADGPEVHFCEALAHKAVGLLGATAMAHFDEVFRN